MTPFEHRQARAHSRNLLPEKKTEHKEDKDGTNDFYSLNENRTIKYHLKHHYYKNNHTTNGRGIG